MIAVNIALILCWLIVVANAVALIATGSVLLGFVLIAATALSAGAVYFALPRGGDN